MKSEQNLLPCPFCGSKGQIRRTKKKYCQLHGEEYQDYIVGCFSSKCPIKPSKIETTNYWAVKNWNSRYCMTGDGYERKLNLI